MMLDDDQKTSVQTMVLVPGPMAPKTMCADNAKKISTNNNKQVGNMLIAKDHKLRFQTPNSNWGKVQGQDEGFVKGGVLFF